MNPSREVILFLCSTLVYATLIFRFRPGMGTAYRDYRQVWPNFGEIDVDWTRALSEDEFDIPGKAIADKSRVS